MTEYLTTSELAERIKMAPGTIRNLIWKGQFHLGTHYVKPTSRKLLFVWPAVETWLHRNDEGASGGSKPLSRSLINI